MQVRTVACECGSSIYMGGPSVICPSCYRKIELVGGEPFMKDNNHPVLNTFKFYPSDLKYFFSEYPEINEKILAIYDNNAVQIFTWNDEMIIEYENSIIDMPKEGVLFSWKSLDEKYKYIGGFS